ncbi:MAG TPA: hypothetical protein VLI41_10000 [Phenylobacterium sp.]|uniref:hypothetical protein n=1 Tax=Phenylobacterium sp. TaxID=1871053 RepID=UPI002C3CCE85|nr:hypothetical protein [Phenylobacterium sp.]HSV03526.1 hypothetical protein [Phenylobacterium sp.]
MPHHSGRWAGVFLAAAAACTAPAALAEPKGVQPGDQGLDLGLLGPRIPDVLKRAAADPYAPPAAPACVTLPQELAQLDALLGPDINPPKARTFSPTDWVGHAIRGAIPYRSYIRFLTGADRKEKALSRAAMAGWARRGFLKGLAAKLDCPSPVQTAEAAPPPAQAEPGAPEMPAAATVEAPVLIPAASLGGGAEAALIHPADVSALQAVQPPEPTDGR